MKILFIISMILYRPLVYGLDKEKKINNIKTEIALKKMWLDQEVYSILEKPDKRESLNGVYYHYSSKKCFKVNHDIFSTRPIQTSIFPCVKNIVELANEPYRKISDFNKYKKLFTSCLEKKDKKCLRSLISFTATIDYGLVPLMDRRDLLLSDWKKENFDEMLHFIKKGTVKRGLAAQTFPPKKSNQSVKISGVFTKKNGFWLLTTYVNLLKKSKYQEDAD